MTGPGWPDFRAACGGTLSAGQPSLLRPESRDFGFDALERAAAFAEAPAGKQIDFVNGLYLFAEKGKIYLAAYEADLPFAQWPQVGQPSAISYQPVRQAWLRPWNWGMGGS